MTVSLLRVDDRLVHGQVVEGWVPYLKADLVVVASDAAAADELQTSLMRMALPGGVELKVVAVRDTARALEADPDARALVLVPGPAEALALLQAGVAVDRVNVGGLHFNAGKIQLGRAVFLGPEDKDALRAIAARGIRLEGRPLPSDPAEDLAAMLEQR
jgi:PTS system mannose-specific IIB component/PTS system galactosamine-specific IIB component